MVKNHWPRSSILIYPTECEKDWDFFLDYAMEHLNVTEECIQFGAILYSFTQET